MSKKKEYIPPEAKVILLAPSENLAVFEWKFGKAWRTEYGYFTENGASGIAVTGTFLDDKWAEDGFVIKQNTQ